MAILDGLALLKAAITSKSATLTSANITTLKNPISAEDTIFELLGANSTIIVGSSVAYGLTRVGYNRMAIESVFPKGLDCLLPAEVDTVYKALPYLSYRTAIPLNEADYLDGPIAYVGNTGTFTLTPADTNLIFTGSVVVKVTKGKKYLHLLSNPVTSLGNLVYPSSDTTKGQAALLSYSSDPTVKAVELSALVAGTTPDQNLVDIVSAITGQTWTLVAGAYSLLGATIDYGGPVSGSYPTKTGFNNLVVITLSASNCTNYAGQI